MKDAPIKRMSTLFLQAVVILIGIGTGAFMLWEPHVEGRNAYATLFEMYFKDPFLAYVYISSILFFVTLYKAFTLLGYIGQNKIFSRDSVRALRTIQYCAVALVALIVAAIVFLIIAQGGRDDIAGGVAMGLFATFISVVIAAAAAVFERIVQSALDRKSENVRTV
ncbi:MAG TPA: DUF2975 domain-containing protein [Candidatus Nanoarchaeia archaeon]|nr:DUF2975 domain-containing protein [Candidatus Nanoarchaeia archaeon]